MPFERSRFSAGAMSRGSALFGAGALVVSAALPARAQATADTVRVGKAVATSLVFAIPEVGNDAGIWKSLNLSLELSSFRGDAQLQAAMAAGSIDVGLGSGPAMAYRIKGVPAIAVAAMAGRPLDMALIVARNSPIKSIGALTGKRVGVTTAGSLTDWLARQVSVDQGWGPDGVTVVPLGGMETRVNALQSGQIEASVHDSTEAYEIERLGKGTIVTLFGDIVKNFDTHVIFAHDNLIAQRTPVLQRFLKGWFSTVAYMHTHKDAAIKTISRVLDVDAAVVAKSYAADLVMLSNDGTFTPAAIDEVRRSIVETGLVDTAPDPKAMYTTRFVPVKL